MDPILTPGYGGWYCLGNGNHCDENGDQIEICCDECDYMMCCMSTPHECAECFHQEGQKCIVNALRGEDRLRGVLPGNS